MRTSDTTIPIAIGLDATSTLEAVVDTKGFRFARISCMANTEVALDPTPGANRLLESDDGTIFSEIADSVAGAGFTPSTTVAQTNIPRMIYDLDLRGRKRFIKVQYQTAATTLPFIVADFAMPISSADTPIPLFAGKFGSDRPSQFLKDVIAGRESLDIIVIGDSNVGSSGGYGQAWNTQMRATGAPMYGIGLITSAQGGSVGAGNITYSGVNVGVVAARTVGQSSGVSWLTPGSLQSIPEINDNWNKNGGTFRPHAGVGTGDYGVEWAYYGSGTNDTTTNFYIRVDPTCPTPPSENWISRIGYVTFDSGSGYFVQRWTTNVSPFTTLAAQQFSTNTGTVGYAIAETEIGADPARTTSIRASVYNAGNSGGALYPNTLGAPAGFMFESAYTRKIGWAVHQMQFYGGATTTQLVDGMTGAGGTMTTYLREVRERQIAAGGRGRILVWLNSGVNGGPADPSNWSEGASDLRDAILSRWQALGYPKEDVAFLFSVSHQYSSNTNMLATYAEARSWVANKDDAAVVDLSIMSNFDRLDSLSLLDPLATVHMTIDGYNYVLKRVIATLTTGYGDTSIAKL